MKILLVNPEFPDTYWSFRHALPFEGKRSAFPPLGLLTVSALLPPSWERRLVDLNVRSLKSSDIDWADMVFATAMLVRPADPASRHSRLRFLGDWIWPAEGSEHAAIHEQFRPRPASIYNAPRSKHACPAL